MVCDGTSPQKIMLTCIYAACKAEENHVSAEELGKGIGQDHHVILNNEMLVFQSLGFDLIVYAPYHTLDGFISDLEEFCGAKDDDQIVALKISLLPLLLFLMVPQKIKASLETARMEADKIMRTNGPLLFPPGQLALAALHRANTEHGIFDFERYLRSVLSRHHPAHTISELTASINAIDSLE
uniref:Cyclin-H1-1-like isoform X3 n=1 Tax=Nicotiana sylvestris TaxID=4096 RepID=A0A1U7V1K2_NICSY|nr:PREDICTED: cyclin-H1-1-like isoform X3 [Nicotiana sylvestris]